MKRVIINQGRFVMMNLVFVFVLGIMYSCSKPSDVPGTNEVFIQDMAFTPSPITVAAGTTITWTNKDGVNHTVTSTTGLFDSGSMSNNGTYSHLFVTAGTFPYKCTIHPSMTASVVVN